MTDHAVPKVDEDPRLRRWLDWYRFARRQLDYGNDEAVAYANVRTVEDENRRRRVAGDPRSV